MSRPYCFCGFVPAYDDHDCPYDDLIQQQIRAENDGDYELAEQIEADLERWEREDAQRGTPKW